MPLPTPPPTDALTLADLRARLAGRSLALIAAASENNIIGRAGDLPWSLPDDLRFFMRSTLGCPVIMGRRTYLSMAGPLPARTNIVVTSSPLAVPPGVLLATSFADALGAAASAPSRTGEVFAGGGGAIYAAAEPIADTIYLTRVHATVDGDATFPIPLPGRWERVADEPHPADPRHAFAFTIQTWRPRPIR